MRVLITGGTGMVGRAVARRLAASHDVVALGRADADLLDAEECLSAITATRPDVLIHAAAHVGGLAASSATHSTYLAQNARLGINVLEAASSRAVPRVLNVSSAVIYPADVDVATEADFLRGAPSVANRGYAIGKIATICFGESLAAERRGFSFKSLVPCNLFGPGDRYDGTRAHLLPSAIKKIVDAQSRGDSDVEVWGDGSARREVLYVEDLAEAIARSLTHWASLPKLLNIGTGVDHSVEEYYRYIAALVGFKGHFIFDDTKPVGPKRRLLDVTKANEWGWRAITSLRVALETTIHDYERGFIKTGHE